MKPTENQFLKDLDKSLWTAADKLRSNLDAAVYKHVVLGLIFLKYVSDAFNERREELQAQFRDPNHDYYLGDDDAAIAEELEVRDYYTEKNVFWIPALARWDFLKAHAKVAPGTDIEVKNGKRTTYKFVSLGRLLDDALDEVEKENPKLKNILSKDYARLQVDTGKLGELIDLIATIPFHHETLEEIAQTIFKSWFVDFDPVRAKASGEPTDSICRRLGLTSDLLAFFPDSFQESELGEIPKEWMVQSVGDVVKRLSVGKKYEQKTVKPSGKVPVLDQGKSGVIGYHDDEPGVTALPERPVAVFANHTCYMRLMYSSFSAIQNVLPFVGKNLDTIWVFYSTYGIQPFIEYKGHWPDFVVHKIVVPDRRLTDVFSKQVHPLLKLLWTKEIETHTLTRLRDILLPKLLSGELRVKEAEKVVEAVA